MNLRPINIAISPNLEFDDFLLALKTLIFGANNKAVEKVTGWFEKRFPGYKAFTFNSGRSAQYALLKAAGVGPGDEVLVQAFTCVAVPNSVIWTGAKPVYADIKKNTYNMDPVNLVKKITPKTKAVIVQHTFGQPADLERIKKICQKNNLLLIEDCAHALGAKYKGKLVGSLSDAAFFSFGRDKIISSVFGGVAITKDKSLAKRISLVSADTPQSSAFWVKQQLMHPIITWFILPCYNLGLGKLSLWLAQHLKLVSKAVYKKEHGAKRPKFFPAKLSRELAVLALNQLKKLDRFNNHRRQIASTYFKAFRNSTIKLPQNDPGSVYLRFCVQVKSPYTIYKRAKKQGMLLGNWYGDVITPAKDYSLVHYKLGTCPVAEKVSPKVLNLPTYPLLTLPQAKKLVDNIKHWL